MEFSEKIPVDNEDEEEFYSTPTAYRNGYQPDLMIHPTDSKHIISDERQLDNRSRISDILVLTV